MNNWNLSFAYEKSGRIEKAIEAMQVCVEFEKKFGLKGAIERLEALKLKKNTPR